ncbi:Com family DNA-binding transcriptional regulator [Acidovorax sp. DW039]|uniref:Com family DNA-binding transcriptional regulator n=1 Tax=Acidovorax sp. DW039 TaxID=3095606 RepID=UPI0030CB6589
MEEIRCGTCARKLAEGVYALLIVKCPRCGTLNHLRAKSPPSERQGAPNPEGFIHGSHHSLDRR